MINSKIKVVFLVTGLVLLICIFFAPETGALQGVVDILVKLYIVAVVIDTLVSLLAYSKNKHSGVS